MVLRQLYMYRFWPSARMMDEVDDAMDRGDQLGDAERGDDQDVETQKAVVALIAGWLYKDSEKTSRCDRIT